MPLSRSAAFRFALERTGVGIAENWVAIVVVSGLCLFGIVADHFVSAGPMKVEPAAVLGFGLYEDEIGSHPIVRVRLIDGGVVEIPAAISSLRGCRKGSRIWLLRWPHRLAVDPRGCPPGLG